MNLTKYFERFHRLHRLIARKATGSPSELAQKLSLSERAVFEYIRAMRELGAPIAFCSVRRTYYYERDVHFQELDDLEFTKDVFAYLGNKNVAGVISLGIEYHKKRFLYFSELHYGRQFREEKVFIFRTVGNIFKRTNTTQYPSDNISITPESLHFKYFPVTFSAGIRLGL